MSEEEFLKYLPRCDACGGVFPVSAGPNGTIIIGKEWTTGAWRPEDVPRRVRPETTGRHAVCAGHDQLRGAAVTTGQRDSHAWCDACKAPPAAPCYHWCKLLPSVAGETEQLRQENQTLRAEKEWLYAENQRLRACVRSARADEAHCWARRVETLTAKVQATDERCTQLLQSMAGARAMQPAPAITVAVDALPGMSPMNRTIAYCAADTLRKLGYAWNGEAWVVPT